MVMTHSFLQDFHWDDRIFRWPYLIAFDNRLLITRTIFSASSSSTTRRFSARLQSPFCVLSLEFEVRCYLLKKFTDWISLSLQRAHLIESSYIQQSVPRVISFVPPLNTRFPHNVSHRRSTFGWFTISPKIPKNRRQWCPNIMWYICNQSSFDFNRTFILYASYGWIDLLLIEFTTCPMFGWSGARKRTTSPLREVTVGV